MEAGRLRSLDGLRAISIAGVFLAGYHWILPCGWIGVLVFYVLSGYLITSILLVEREAARAGDRPDAGGFFGRFYFRRTLRIFPVYFAYLAVLELAYLLFRAPAAWETVRPFAFLYVVNFGMVAGSVDSADAYGHLWTLSVEEQFYLAWPLVVWCLSRASLLRVAAALLVAGPLIRLASLALLDRDIGRLYVSSFSHLDAFATGALVALGAGQWIRRALPAALAAIALTLAVGIGMALSTGTALRTLGYPEGLSLGYAYIWGYSVLNLCAGLVILAALRGELRWLGTPVLAYLGRISYGIYLFQRPIKGVYLEQVEPALVAALGSRPAAQALGAVLCMAVAVGIAALSYRYLEAPLLRYRDRKCPPLRQAASARPEP